MVANTFNMTDRPVINTTDTEPRSDMFAQSAALYGRVNKRRTGVSPWMIIAPIAVVVLGGGALLASSGRPTTHTVTRTSTATVAAAPITEPALATPVIKAPVLKVVPAPAKAAPAARIVPTSAPAPLHVERATTRHATSVKVAAPAPTVSAQPTPIVPSPTTVAPSTAAPDTAPAPTPAPSADPAPATPPGA